ncbi:non-heme iron oxygenase ferredoxin subunit [Thalassoglobus polymorphus]|uniref:Ferredoxin CarAc n=1 Tax=Thalassoglobus polymorphus TaxID=2527994 RepID=A0A517QVH7_9PLAN|nr:non-heme iron oxygenase ferredoxin subunit [Thalassoglobus polymorphus]QDT35639.1 Ferredoxin CarAc [Thalassoglobus polymorphus]
MSDHFEKVGLVSEIPDVGRLSVILGDEVSALVLRAGDDFYCVEDICTHDGQPMTDGDFDGCELTCPRHGAKFNVKTGAATQMPATEPVRTFPVEIRNGEIYVEYDD